MAVHLEERPVRQCVLDLMTLNHRVPRFEPWSVHQVLQAPFETRRLKRLFKRCFCQSGEQPNLDDNVIGFVAPTSKAVLAEQSIWSTETLSPADLEQTPWQSLARYVFDAGSPSVPALRTRRSRRKRGRNWSVSPISTPRRPAKQS